MTSSNGCARAMQERGRRAGRSGPLPGSRSYPADRRSLGRAPPAVADCRAPPIRSSTGSRAAARHLHLARSGRIYRMSARRDHRVRRVDDQRGRARMALAVPLGSRRHRPGSRRPERPGSTDAVSTGRGSTSAAASAPRSRNSDAGPCGASCAGPGIGPARRATHRLRAQLARHAQSARSRRRRRANGERVRASHMPRRSPANLSRAPSGDRCNSPQAASP